MHPRVYTILIGLTAWFALAVWSFAGAAVFRLRCPFASGEQLVLLLHEFGDVRERGALRRLIGAANIIPLVIQILRSSPA
jgi:hypothetical protein